jgi:CubicO group peptidase (beta-lactamase class C family)
MMPVSCCPRFLLNDRVFCGVLFLLLLFFPCLMHAQPHKALADSVRLAYKIPALGYAVVSGDAMLEIDVDGLRQLGADRRAALGDRFRIGSNTKAFTGMIAAILVQEGKLAWEMPFFSLFPELKGRANKAYHGLTLLNLVSFRTWFSRWTYSNALPLPRNIKGDAQAQRYNFVRWFLQEKPVYDGVEYNRSNLSFVAAGLMLERASGKSFEQLAIELGQRLGIEVGFGSPNSHDPAGIWGHDAGLVPEGPGDNVRLNWLMAAGNIQLSLPDYCKFLQLQLLGLSGRCPWLPRATFEFLHFGLPDFAVGWFWEVNAAGQRVSRNLGNPGTFLCRVLVNPAADRAYVVVANCMTDLAHVGTEVLMERIQE